MGDEQKCSKKKKKMHSTIKKRGWKKMHGGEKVFDYSCLPFWFFFSPFKTQEKSEEIKLKKNLNHELCSWEQKKMWKFNGVEVVSTITRCWSFGLRKNITVLEIPRNRVHLSVTSERVGGWGGYMCSRVARSIPGENKHSSLTLLTALLTHEICFSLPFFFYYQC